MEFLISKKELENLQNGRTKIIQLFKDRLEFRAFDYGQEITTVVITEKGNEND